MTQYEDRSYPHIGDMLRYTRGDGALVELKITMPVDASGRAWPAGVPPVTYNEVPMTTLKVSSLATLRTEPQKVNRPIQVHPGTGTKKDVIAMDTSTVGNKFTIFVLFYGGEEFYSMHRRCIDSIIATVPSDRVDIRVGSNQLNQKSVAMLDAYVERKQITKHYRHTENAMKYPVMREMFFDPECPITTKWVIWFDDDSICDKNPEWLQLLTQHISMHHKGKYHMFGSRLVWTLSPQQQNVLRSRAWYTGKHWQNAGGKTVPGGTKICFATGGFWAITHEAIVQCDIPDLTTGLTHNGGDWQIGCQLYQQGYDVKQFNNHKQIVNTSSVPRRGITSALIKDTPPTSPVLPAIPQRPHRQQRQVYPEQIVVADTASLPKGVIQL